MLGYGEKDGNVVLEMTHSDYNFLLFSLGIATGATVTRQRGTSINSLLGLINRLNQGNPHFLPYETEETTGRT
jgi:hypothetical protein